MVKLTKKMALTAFVEDHGKDWIKKQTPTTMRCLWNDYVDFMHKQGHVTDKQANNWTNPFDK